MKKHENAIFWKGLIIGGTMIVPGVSGGTMAMILGIYDKLIFTVSSFRKAPWENFWVLIKFAAGAGAGILLLASPISWLLETYEVPVIYFFMGLVFGGIPMIEKKSGMKKFYGKALLYMAAGTVIVLMISAIPAAALNMNRNLLMLFLLGVIASVALILPGISISHLFLILGLYEEILEALRILDFTMLIPLTAGVGIGIILFSKILEGMMGRFPEQTYMMILGFILGAIAGIFPGVPNGVGHGIVSFGLFLLGFLIIYTIQKKYET